MAVCENVKHSAKSSQNWCKTWHNNQENKFKGLDTNVGNKFLFKIINTCGRTCPNLISFTDRTTHHTRGIPSLLQIRYCFANPRISSLQSRFNNREEESIVRFYCRSFSFGVQRNRKSEEREGRVTFVPIDLIFLMFQK